jgi:chromosome segregation ATPase
VEHERTIEAKELEIKNIRSQAQDRERQLEASLKKELEIVKSESAQEVSTLLSRIASLEGGISKLNSELALAADRYHTLSSDSCDSEARHMSEIKELGRQITAMESEKEAISSLLESERVRADKNHSEKVKWEALAGEVEHWKLQTELAWKQVDSMRKQLEECGLNFEALKLEKSQLLTERDELKRLSSGLGGRILLLESEIGAFKAAVLESDDGSTTNMSNSYQRGDVNSISPIVITPFLQSASATKKSSLKRNVSKK